jgi:SAM-dependent methyltransferase
MHADHEAHTGPVDYDAELRRHDEALRRACRIRSRDHVLDIGCGTGHTTRQAALAAPAGRALGLDVSAPAIARARLLARDARIRNVAFDCADAQDHHLPPERFDVAISRFGTMFFDDPAAAFANIRRALRADGRLVMMVWQAGDRNEWDVAIRRALGGSRGPAAIVPGGPDPFSLADPAAVRALLAAAGFEDVAFADVHEPVYYGPDVDRALDWVRGFTCTSCALEQLDGADAARAEERLRQALDAHRRDDGVWFDARAWIVTARRGAGGPTS